MIEFKNTKDYNLNTEEMLKYSLNYFTKEETQQFDINVVLKDLDVNGLLFSLNNRYMFYKLTKDGYLPFYLEYTDNKKIVNKNEFYTLCKGEDYATIIDNDKKNEIIISYISGYIKYNYHDLHNDKLYTFFYKQGLIMNNHKPFIAGDYLDLPDGFCYQESPKSYLSYGYFKQDVSSINPLAVLSESNGLLNFFDKYEEFRKQGFPNLELYTKIKKSNDKYMKNITSFGFKNEDNYLKSLNNLEVSYKIPQILIDFYNGSFEIELYLDEIIDNYKTMQKNEILKRKMS